MLSPRWRKVVRDVWLHKSRTFLVVVAITIGLIGAGSVLDTWSLMRQVTREEFRASNPASATLRIAASGDAPAGTPGGESDGGISAAFMARVRALPTIQAAQARRSVSGTVQVQGSPRTIVLFALNDFTSNRIGRVQSESGSWPPGDGDIVIERSSVDFIELPVDQSITVQVGSAAPQELQVTGVARDVGLAPGWMEHVVYAFVTPATLAQLGVPSGLNELQLVLADRSLDREGVRRIAFAIKRMLEASGHRVSDVDVPVPGRHIHAAQIDSLLYTQGAFGALALLLSGILVVNLIAAMLMGQVREIGIMKTIGAGQWQIAGMYLALALVLGLVATAVAIPTAAFIGRQYANFTAELLNFSTTGYAIPRWSFVLQLAVGALLPLFAAAIPVVRGCRISVSEALRDLGISLSAGASTAWLTGIGGLTRPLILSVRNAFRRRQRMALTLVTLSMGGAVYIGALNLKESVRGAVDLLFSAQRYDILLRFARSWPADSLEAAVGRVAGVTRVETWSGGRANHERTDGTLGNAFPISAPPAESRMFGAQVTSGRWLRSRDSNAVVINRQLQADQPGLAVGATVTLRIAGKSTPWNVVGVVDGGPSSSAYVARESFAALVAGGRVNLAVVSASLPGAASQFDLVQRLRAELAAAGFEVQTSQLTTENRRVIEDHLLMVADFLGIMAQLMIVVGGLGLASTMSLAVLERTREIGVLRAIGARHRSIITMIQVEGLVIAILSWIVAIPLSLPMSVLLGQAFSRIMLPVPITFLPNAAAVLSWFGVVVVVSLVACAWPAFRALRITTAAALAYE